MSAELTDAREAAALLAEYVASLERLGWAALWSAYAEERTTLLGRKQVAGRAVERYEQLTAPSGRRYGARSWASADASPMLHILIVLHENDSALRTLGGSLIVKPDDFD